MFIVGGGTGNVGSAVVQKLSQAGNATVKVLTRSSAGDKVAAIKDLPRVEIVECDLENKEQLTKAFEGVKYAFLACANSLKQVQHETNFIDCAVAAGCTYLVKLGTVRSYTSRDSACQYARYHAEVEDYLKANAGDMKWTVLSPNWFMSNHLGDIFGTLPKSIIAYPVLSEAKVRTIDPRDVGEIGAQMLLASDVSTFHGKFLDMSGPEDVSMGQIAALYTDALGRPIQMISCSKDDWIKGAMGAGFEEWFANAVYLNFPKMEDGSLQFPTSPEILELAKPERTMAQWVKEWAPRSPPVEN